MSHCILDSSAALAWVLPGESDPASDILLRAVARLGATVTGLWSLEIANVMLMAQRRGRITTSERRQAMASLADLPIRTDALTHAQAWKDTLALAENNDLTVYDATYLEVAIRLALPLATRDDALRGAAEACGVAVIR